MWNFVIPHFTDFLKQLQLEPTERLDAESKAERIARCLFARYYAGDFDPNYYVIVGSHGKKTAAKPKSDLDMLFLLPHQVFDRIRRLNGNKQSQLLQEIKKALELTFPRTDLSADGQVVSAPFQTYNVEIVPAFRTNDGTYVTASTANGGSWRGSNPAAEYREIVEADAASAGKATHLLQMLKAWKCECSVDIKSISLEVLACLFVKQWPWRNQTIFYYDWLIRDFFEFMLLYRNGSTRVLGTNEWIELGDSWYSKCQTAYQRAVKACEYERADFGYAASDEWQKIFGELFHAPFSRLAEAFAPAR